MTATVAYGITDWAPLAVVVLFTHLEILQQLIPVVRFDGYYILGDVTGVPNLFGRIGPILRSLLPARTVDTQVNDLRTRTRVVVTAWVLVTVPTLLLGLVLLLAHAPGYVSDVWVQSKALWSTGDASLRAGDVAAAALAFFSILALTLPLVGMLAVLTRSLVHAGRAIRARTNASRPTPPKEASVDSTSQQPRIAPSPGGWGSRPSTGPGPTTQRRELHRGDHAAPPSRPPRHGCGEAPILPPLAVNVGRAQPNSVSNSDRPDQSPDPG